jgi:ABC-type multidrug transport system ATPase subunit
MPMQLSFHLRLQSVGRTFNRRWIFRGIDLEAYAGERIAILGSNGSGKSTLMHIIAGQLSASAGSVEQVKNQSSIAREDWYQHLSWMGPYIELYPYLSVQETVTLHFRFKQCLLAQPLELLEHIQLTQQLNQPLHELSSGMIQRLKVALAIFTQSDLLLLDEPTSFMDQQYTRLILDLIAQHTADRLLILASNLPVEYQSLDCRPFQLHLS